MCSLSNFERLLVVENTTRQQQQPMNVDGMSTGNISSTTLVSCASSPSSSSASSPSCFWRSKVVQWFYDVVDHLNEERSIVYVAMNILDRYITAITSSSNSSVTQSIDETKYEIASLASIFLAVHISGSGDLTLQELVGMSRGGITVHDIIHEGTVITTVLSLSQPIVTPVDFVRSILQLIPSIRNSVHEQVLLDSASYLIELAVCDEFFMNYKSSSLAIAAIFCSMESNIVLDNGKYMKEEFIKATTTITTNTFDEISMLCTRLKCIYSQNVENLLDQSGPHLIEDDDDDKKF